MQKLNTLKIFLFFIATILFLFFTSLLLPHSVSALEENFDTFPLDNDIWQTFQNEGLLNVENGILHISAGNTTTFPFIYSKINLIPSSGDFSVKFKMKYNNATTKGTGLILSMAIPPNGSGDTLLNDPLFSQRHFLEVWQSSSMGFFFAYSGDCYSQSCLLDQILVYQKNGIDLNYHDIEFQYSNNRYSIFLDESKVFTSNPTNLRPNTLWFGNYTHQGSGDTWADFEIDFIHISSPSPTPTLTPTPSPTPIPIPTPLQPLVFLPGFGGSWNHENMILGIEKPQSEWYMTPGIKVYDGLIETLKNIGYKTEGNDKNLFIFNYNWAKPVVSVAEDLKNYIQNVVKPSSGEKIDLVGHSLGGLVARTYVQNNQDNPVDQLLTIGSPLKGIPSIYYLWEGGNLNKSFSGWQRIGAGLLLHLRKSGFSTTMEAARSVVPSLKDLLPTFNYLKQNSQEKPLSQMSQKNDWLIALNNSLPNHLISIANNLVGILPNSTIRWFNVSNPPWVDHLLGLWTDGKPENEEYANGDQTVLTESGSLDGAAITDLLNLGHQDLVTSITGQQKIIEILGLSSTSISTASTEIDYEHSLVFQIASPATLSIIGPNGNPAGYGDGKLIIVPNAQEGEYQIKVNGIGQGEYQLHIGQITNNKDIWTTTSGLINSGEEIIHEVNFNVSSPLENPLVDQTGEESIKSARSKLFDLKNKVNQENLNKAVKRTILTRLNQIIRLLDKGKIENSVVSLYRLYHQINSWQLAEKLDENNSRYFKNKIQEIIEDLEKAYVTIETNKGGFYNPPRLAKEIKLAQKSFEKMEGKLQKKSEKGITNPELGALYLLAQEKLNKAKSLTSFRAHINALGAQFISQEILFFK